MARQWFAETEQVHEDGSEEWYAEAVQVNETDAGGGGAPFDPATGLPFYQPHLTDRRPPRVVAY